MGSSIIINGNQIISNGNNNIIVSGNKIFIDGNDVTPDAKEINIEVNGNIERLEVDNCNNIKVIGECKSVKSHNASIDIEGNVDGDVTTHNGNIDCQNVSGSVSTKNGNIKHRK